MKRTGHKTKISASAPNGFTSPALSWLSWLQHSSLSQLQRLGSGLTAEQFYRQSKSGNLNLTNPVRIM